MTTERVFPREAMTAERRPFNNGGVNYWATCPSPHSAVTAHGTHDDHVHTDAEFAAAFRPASDLDELLHAVRAETMYHRLADVGPLCPCRLCAALRRWDGDQ